MVAVPGPRSAVVTSVLMTAATTAPGRVAGADKEAEMATEIAAAVMIEMEDAAVLPR